MTHALVVGDPVRRFGFLWRAPIVDYDANPYRAIGWGGWSLDPTRAEVRALQAIRRRRVAENRGS